MTVEWYGRNPGRRPPFDPAAYADCEECGAWPTHAPGCPLRLDHTDGGL